MLFSELGLSAEILRAIEDAGYSTPTPIQIQAIPAVLEGRDMLAGAQTGTGKTAGFTLPLLHRLSNRTTPGPSAGRPPIRALILTPTRELAAQVEESVRTYGKYLKLTTMAMFGGVSINPQIKGLRGRIDILVATPGRLLDHVSQGTIDLSQIEILVLDEADRMLDMGFIRDIRRVIALLPRKRQNLLFSATCSDEIKTLADGILSNPAYVEVSRRNATVEAISQRVYIVDRDKKRDVLVHLIKEQDWSQVLVFTRTKHGANALAEKLVKADISTMAIHGNKSQTARTRALAEFKTGQLRVLVATDIAARGLDIDQLPHVVNYELPDVAESYVHRIGRTGRAGAAGSAISLVCVDEFKLLRDIERLIKNEIEQHTLAGFEPDRNAKPQPIQLRSPGVRGGQRQNRGQGDGAAVRGRSTAAVTRPDRAPASRQGRIAHHANQSLSENHAPRGEINGNTWETTAPRPAVSPGRRQNSDRSRTASKPSISQSHSGAPRTYGGGQGRGRREG
ncbi:MAG: DEAD/DEAH box helicase [Nitrosomonas sp.]|nr:DEAD/DEAH box helicase [Nitrosomonas sp.]